MELGSVQPFGGFVFEQGQVPAFDGAVKSVHGQVELWIVVIDRADEAAYGNVYGEFFLEFAGKRLFAGFAGFHLAAGEFPAALKVSVTARGCKDFFSVLDDACDNFDGLHGMGM